MSPWREPNPNYCYSRLKSPRKEFRYIFESQDDIEQYKNWLHDKETAEEKRAFEENRPMPAYCQSCHNHQSGPRLMQCRDDYIMSISDSYREHCERKRKEKAKEREKRQKKDKEAKRSSDNGEVNWNVAAERDDSNLFFYDGSKDKKTADTHSRFLKGEPDGKDKDQETAIALLTKFFEGEPDSRDKRTSIFPTSVLKDESDREVVQSVEYVAGTLEGFAGAIEDMPDIRDMDGYDQYLAMKTATAGDNDGSASEWNSEDCSSEDFPIN